MTAPPTGAAAGLPAAAATPLFAGRYRLLRVVGAGAAGRVYLARDVRAAGGDRVVALKLLDARRLRQPDAPGRLAQAARGWQALSHPGVVALLDWGWAAPVGPVAPTGLDGPGETAYLAMQHVAGRSLCWHVQARGPLPVAQAVGIARQVLAALAAAHAAGLTHGDLRPGSILLAPDGVPRVADFGLAAALGYSAPHYLSPEQAQGRPATPAADLYSLGVVLYEMLADAVPFDSPLPEVVLLGHAVAAPTPPRRLRPSLPLGLDDVVLRALAKRPADRWPSADAFAAALAPFAEPAAGVLAAREPRPQPQWTAMLAVREQDLAPVAPGARGRGLLAGRRLGRRGAVALAALALALALLLGYAAGWRVRVSLPGAAEVAVVRVATPTAGGAVSRPPAPRSGTPTPARPVAAASPQLRRPRQPTARRPTTRTRPSPRRSGRWLRRSAARRPGSRSPERCRWRPVTPTCASASPVPAPTASTSRAAAGSSSPRRWPTRRRAPAPRSSSTSSSTPATTWPAASPGRATCWRATTSSIGRSRPRRPTGGRRRPGAAARARRRRSRPTSTT